MFEISQPSPRRKVADALTTNLEFQVFVAPHLAVLRALAARQVGTGDAEDVVQDALMRAWSRRATFREDLGSPRAWLCAIVLDQGRRRRTRRRPVVTPSIARELLDVAEAAGIRVDVERAVAGLPSRQRQVVTLHYLADLPVDEVAVILGVSSGTVKSRLFDARRNLRNALEGPHDD